jgi:hypothetical protein
MIFRLDIGFGHAGGRTGMIRFGTLASSTNFTLLSFSSATQRQFDGEPTGGTLWLSPPHG